MQLLILGATGPSGQQLVKQALERGHQVTALVRNPEKLNIPHEHLIVITGDVLDERTLTNALNGTDVVLSALGNGMNLKSSGIMTKALGNLIPCMRAAAVSRVVMLSAFGVGETFSQANLFQRIIFRTFLRGIYGDKNKADAMLRQSELDWTLVCPVRLTNGPATGDYKVGEVLPMKGRPIISRADVAHFMLQELKDKTYSRKIAVLRN